MCSLLNRAVPLEAVKLGLQYVDGSIRGANARCASMLAMLMHIIKVRAVCAASHAPRKWAGHASWRIVNMGAMSSRFSASDCSVVL